MNRPLPSPHRSNAPVHSAETCRFETWQSAGTSRHGLAQPRVEVDSLDAAGWERLVATFDDATYDQGHAYAASVWGEHRLSHIVVHDGDRIIGAALVVLLQVPGTGRGLAYVKFGPLWRRRGG